MATKTTNPLPTVGQTRDSSSASKQLKQTVRVWDVSLGHGYEKTAGHAWQFCQIGGCQCHSSSITTSRARPLWFFPITITKIAVAEGLKAVKC